jgi:hypothetical protein
MLLLKERRDAGTVPGQDVGAAMGRYLDDLTKAGVLLAANALQPSSAGVRLRFAGPERLVDDGPFRESTPVAGCLVIQVKSREEAIEWASRCPLDQIPVDGEASVVEVRQVVEGTYLG